MCFLRQFINIQIYDLILDNFTSHELKKNDLYLFSYFKIYLYFIQFVFERVTFAFSHKSPKVKEEILKSIQRVLNE